jgi:hypothetical protein
VIEVPERRSPLAGGVLFEDLFPSQAIESATVEADENAFILVARTSKRKNSGTSRIFFDRSTLLPFRREVYSSSGRLLKTVQIDEMRAWGQVQIPWKIRFVDHLRKGAEVRIDIIRATALTADDEQLIAREHLVVPPDDDPADNP